MGDEYKLLLDAVDDRLKMHDKINMVAELDEFTFYGDLESFREDFHFGTHEYRHLGRCAFVGNAEWMKLFVKFTEHLVRADEKMFPTGSLDEAIAWACSGE
ncbi:MAG: STAS/SEC14 domain-containing protein [Actinobacteria bacterium]|nr:STAS/SEC14 domain-containing protein [Actinomycetota bacterium]